MGVIDVIAGAIPSLGTLAKDIRIAITGEISAEKKAELELKLQEFETQLVLAQAEINKIEAASDSKFKSWWRPSVGWVCVCGLALMLVIRPIAQWIVNVTMLNPVHIVELDSETLIGLLVPLLGLGAYRTYEKTRVNGH